VAKRIAFLTGYQDAAYAAQYQAFVERVRVAEQPLRSTRLAESVARYLFKLMAYKDEYEVARLYSAPEFRRQLEAEFDGVRELRIHLAPPLFAARDPATGQLVKREYGPWMLTAMGWLAKGRRWRGTAFDIFGRTQERRMERALIEEYAARIEALLPALDATRVAHAAQVAEVADRIRGFGHVKHANVQLARAAWQALQAPTVSATAPLRQAA